MIVLIDTREKDPHIELRLKYLGIPFKKQKLHFGDYSFEYNGKSYENEIVVERKASIDEIIGNFTKGRERFKKEFQRSKGCNVILMIEALESDIEQHRYRSSMSPSKVKSFIKTWSYKFELKQVFIERSKACEFILREFQSYLREKTEVRL